METLSMNEMNIPYINEIVDIIVSLTEPEKIILFGSYARGDASNKSDIDLLILIKGLKSEHEMYCTIENAFYNNKINVAIDHISMDYDKYHTLKDVIGYIYKTINEEGKVIYETVH